MPKELEIYVEIDNNSELSGPALIKINEDGTASLTPIKYRNLKNNEIGEWKRFYKKNILNYIAGLTREAMDCLYAWRDAEQVRLSSGHVKNEDLYQFSDNLVNHPLQSLINKLNRDHQSISDGAAIKPPGLDEFMPNHYSISFPACHPLNTTKTFDPLTGQEEVFFKSPLTVEMESCMDKMELMPPKWTKGTSTEQQQAIFNAKAAMKKNPGSFLGLSEEELRKDTEIGLDFMGINPLIDMATSPDQSGYARVKVDESGKPSFEPITKELFYKTPSEEAPAYFDKHIKVIKEGERGYGEYTFKVLSPNNGAATHHTNDKDDAIDWYIKRYHGLSHPIEDDKERKMTNEIIERGGE